MQPPYGRQCGCKPTGESCGKFFRCSVLEAQHRISINNTHTCIYCQASPELTTYEGKPTLAMTIRQQTPAVAAATATGSRPELTSLAEVLLYIVDLTSKQLAIRPMLD